MVRGEITFKAGSIPDYVIVRADGSPLYTLVNPVDDALMGITHVLRGEDLLSSTPRQVVLIRALMDIGVASYMPVFGHLPVRHGRGQQEALQARPPVQPVPAPGPRLHSRGPAELPVPAGLEPSADEDIFTVDQLIEHFDVNDVLANPARFDIKKAEAINGTHIRMLGAEDFRGRLVPYLQAAGFVGESLTAREEEILAEAAPLIQERISLLGEAPEMLAFLFKADDAIDVADDARKGLPENLTEVLDAALAALEPVADWTAGEHPGRPEGGPRGRPRRQAAAGVRAGPHGHLGPPDLPAAVRVHGHPGQGLIPGPPARFPRLMPCWHAGGPRTRFGTVRGVLFDIDDTLVDLEFAMTTALRDVSEHLLPGLDEAGWERFGRIFTHETTHFYDRYLAGEMTFNEQRLLRGRAALGHFGVELADGEQAHHWVSSYASRQHGYVRAFDDVGPLLDALDAAGIPYGAVSNNVHDYQRVKLDAAGLERITVLVGTDTVGVAKAGPGDLPRGRPAARYRSRPDAVRR